MARVLRMSLAAHLPGQGVVEVGGGTNRNRRSVHGVLDVAEVRDTRCRVVVPQSRDLDRLERDRGEDVLPSCEIVRLWMLPGQ